MGLQAGFGRPGLVKVGPWQRFSWGNERVIILSCVCPPDRVVLSSFPPPPHSQLCPLRAQGQSPSLSLSAHWLALPIWVPSLPKSPTLQPQYQRLGQDP